MRYTRHKELQKDWSAITFGCWQIAPSEGWGALYPYLLQYPGPVFMTPAILRGVFAVARPSSRRSVLRLSTFRGHREESCSPAACPPRRAGAGR